MFYECFLLINKGCTPRDEISQLKAGCARNTEHEGYQLDWMRKNVEWQNIAAQRKKSSKNSVGQGNNSQFLYSDSHKNILENDC